MTTAVEPREWRRYGLGGPPEPWQQDALLDIDRLATSYYLEVMELRSQILAAHPDEELWLKVEELNTTATRHKTEIDYTLRHWATPAERARALSPQPVHLGHVPVRADIPPAWDR